jgi:hypothetical protein
MIDSYNTGYQDGYLRGENNPDKYGIVHYLEVIDYLQGYARGLLDVITDMQNRKMRDV